MAKLILKLPKPEPEPDLRGPKGDKGDPGRDGKDGEKAGTGGGLSQQEVRDAMTLPATDTPEPGSIDTKLNVITALSS